MRLLTLCLTSAAAMLAPEAAAAQPPRAAGAETDWLSTVMVVRLRDEFLGRPADARRDAPHPQSWAMFPHRILLPEPFRSRALDHDSFVVIDLDPAGHAAACRPLRPSREPRLDAAACATMMIPGYFSASLVPPREPMSGSWVFAVIFETMTGAEARRRAAAPQTLISPAPPPAQPPR
ncbi:MAG TPA: hypothetical protein VGB08_00040 [Allosphingosinicella sp.]|jgi:hypothetical protein